jgi:multiple antibiotic resistance protein
MEHHLQAIVTVLSLVNPVICGAMFARIEAGQSRAAQLADATRAALAVLVMLGVTALVGARVLQVFGVSLEAFSIAGGGLLALIGFSMLRRGCFITRFLTACTPKKPWKAGFSGRPS